jgi:hypothetical protein
MKIGDIVNYFSKEAEVVLFNTSHVVIKFKDGSKLCTNKLTFSKL